MPKRRRVGVQVVESWRRGLNGVCFFRFKHLYGRLGELKGVLEAVS